MTTTELVTLADIEGSANNWGSGNAQLVLRRVAIPAVFQDIDVGIGRVWWRRATASISLTLIARNYDLPLEFNRMEDAFLYRSTDRVGRLIYVGESLDSIIELEAADPGPPGHYYYGAGVAAANYRSIRFGRLPDEAYTLRYGYYRDVPFPDNTTVVDLDLYIPPAYQHGFAKRYRMEILRDRVGIKDQRYNVERDEYMRFLEALNASKEVAPRGEAGVKFA